MKAQESRNLYQCPKCHAKDTVEVKVKQRKDGIVETSIKKCSNCNEYIYMKELHDFLTGKELEIKPQ